MNTFLSKHADDVTGTVSGFDRLVFRGTLRRLVYPEGMKTFLNSVAVLLKDFSKYVLATSNRLKEASADVASQASRPLIYLPSSATKKETIARQIAVKQTIREGLVCILTAVEPCNSFDIFKNRETKRLELVNRHRKCLHIYHYLFHPVFGFMNARIQTWFPFSIQICINGREWLARQMDEAGLGYQRRDNCFSWLENPVEAQRLMDLQLRAAWPGLLREISRGLHPFHEELFAKFPVDYYWSVFQSEWATDVMFRDAAALERLYPKLVRHGLTTFLSSDVMRFLGKNISAEGTIPPAFKAEVISDIKKRPEGVRIKHRMGANSIKLYDKQGSVLRVETTINDAAGFKVFRPVEGKESEEKMWLPMRKGIADLHRRTEVSQAANNRYLQAMAAVENTTPLGSLTENLCQPAFVKGRRVRALNPYSPDDMKLLSAINRGEFTIAGFRNRDLKSLLFPDAGSSEKESRRCSGAVTRKLLLLRAHGLIKKVTGTHRYQLTLKGRTATTALLVASNADSDSLLKLAA